MSGNAFQDSRARRKIKRYLRISLLSKDVSLRIPWLLTNFRYQRKIITIIDTMLLRMRYLLHLLSIRIRYIFFVKFGINRSICKAFLSLIKMTYVSYLSFLNLLFLFPTKRSKVLYIIRNNDTIQFLQKYLLYFRPCIRIHRFADISFAASYRRYRVISIVSTTLWNRDISRLVSRKD